MFNFLNLTYKNKVIVRRIMTISILLIISFTSMAKLVDIDYFKLNNYKDIQLSLLTINSILIGFMFTTLGIFITAIESSSLKKHQSFVKFDLLIISIILGLILFTISMFLNIIIILMNKDLFLSISKFLIMLELTILIAGIIIFIFAIIDSILMIRILRKGHKRYSKEEIDEFRKNLDNN